MLPKSNPWQGGDNRQLFARWRSFKLAFGLGCLPMLISVPFGDGFAYIALLPKGWGSAPARNQPWSLISVN